MCPCGCVLVFEHPILPPWHEERDPRSRSSCQGWFSTPQYHVFVSGVSLHPSHHPLPPRHPPCTLYCPDARNATLQSRSSCLGCPWSRSSCLGCPCTFYCTLPCTLYHPPLDPDTENATIGSRSPCLDCSPSSQTRKRNAFSCLGYFPIRIILVYCIYY